MARVREAMQEKNQTKPNQQSQQVKQLKYDIFGLLEGYHIISNPHASVQGRTGGRPAIIIAKDKYHIKNMSNTVMETPWRVEATWGLITPKKVPHSFTKQDIGPKSKVKTQLLDNLCQSYQILSARYGKGLQFIICTDANKLDLDHVLTLTPSMKQMVTTPTRLNPK